MYLYLSPYAAMACPFRTSHSPTSLPLHVTRVPGMRAVWEGASPSANLMEAKAREAQGRHREVGSEGSVEQTYEPTNGNWISRRQGRTSQRVVTKSISSKDRKRKSSGCVRKGSVLTPGGLGGCPFVQAGQTQTFEGTVGKGLHFETDPGEITLEVIVKVWISRW